QGTTLSQENIKIVIDELQKIRPSFVTISGGEPLLIGESVFDVARDMKKYCKRIFLTTNGQLIKNFPAYLFNAFDDVQISLDGTREIHEKIRGANTFENAIESAIYLKLSGIHVTLLMTLNCLNKNILKETYAIAKRLEIPFGAERMTPIGNGKSMKSISSKEWKGLLKLIVENEISCRDPLRFIFKNNLKKINSYKITGGCTAGIASLVINSNLDIYPCVRLRIPVGNLKNRSLEDIWMNSEILNKFRNRSAFNGKCGLCRYRNICGGCRADAFALTGDYLGSDTTCWLEEGL
ncbi:MAG: radical SAM protein, partial [Minisyncoccia bacterium]